MIIRTQQMAAFEAMARRGFEGELAGRCTSAAPALSEGAGGENVARFVKMGVDRAGSHGFTLRGPVRLYVDLMLGFGCDFDTDLQLAWAQEALAAGPAEDEMSRAKALYGAAQSYTQRVAGPNREHTRAAFERLSRLSESVCPKLGATFEDDLMRLFRALYPEKFEYAGPDAVRPLVARAARTAAGFGVRLGTAAALLAATMFLFGHGVAEDPMHPWIAAALGGPETSSPQDRAANLFRSMVKAAGRAQRDLEPRSA